MTDSALWTALPNGVGSDGRSLRASVFVSPRLVTHDGQLGRLPDFPLFVHWPLIAREIHVRVAVDGFGELDAGRDPLSPAPDPGLWDALFARVPVRSHRFDDLSTRRIRSYPVGDVLAAALGLYARVASTSPTALADPSAINTLAGKLGSALAGSAGDPVALDGQIAAAAASDPSAAAEQAFLLAERFYTRPGTRDAYRRSPDPAHTPAPVPAADVDFHAAVAFLADYPRLLRLLGLVLDVVIERRDQMPASGRVRAVLSGPPEATGLFAEELRPWTAYALDPPRWVARPRQPSDLADGMLALDRPGFVVYDVDVDGTALKLINQTVAAARQLDPALAGLQALRSGGITVARSGRADQLKAQLLVAKDLAGQVAGKKVPALTADDVTRGFRVEVSEDGSIWRSLCQRSARYQLVARNEPARSIPVEPDDEGYVKGPSTTSAPGDADLYLHEAVLGWDGWSLVAPRPGRNVQPDDQVGVAPTAPGTPVPLSVQTTARKGSLPPLRFGRTYRLRARAVDLAGNSVDPTAIPPGHETPPVTHRRFDPVPSPSILARRPFSEAESLRRLIVRSAPGLTPGQYVASLGPIAGHEPAHDGFADRTYQPVNERHLAAPIASQRLAETHGLFDGAIGHSDQPALDAGFALAAREARSWYDAAGARVVTAAGAFAAPPPTPGAPLPGGAYVIADQPSVITPYLPDPLARGVALAHPDGTLAVNPQRFTGTWPDLTSLLLRLEGSLVGTPVAFGGDSGTVTVTLPQAEQATLRVSCILNQADLPLLAVMALLGPNVPDAVSRAALQGQHPMLTPYEEIVLVHAVERPLADPVLVVGSVARDQGSTSAALIGHVQVHAKSTGRADLLAEWTEPLDDVAQPAPVTIPGRAHWSDFTITATEDQAAIGRTDVLSAPPVHRAEHDFADTRYRQIRCHPVATTRFRDCFPPVIAQDQSRITTIGQPVTVTIPSSRRPDPPDVAYLIPTFRWDQTVTNQPRPTVTRTRQGNGLRVYLNRPWYSSGDGEQLAVLLADQTPPLPIPHRPPVITSPPVVTSPPAAACLVSDTDTGGLAVPHSLPTPHLAAALGQPGLDKLTSQWGVDPAWTQKATPASGPRAAQLPSRAGFRAGLSLAELQAATVAAAIHDVRFDQTRGLWACDIHLDTGQSYFPFVRLALARYQPHSLAGVELSAVVLADFGQLPPDRTATVIGLASGVIEVTVTGPAPAEVLDAGAITPNPAQPLPAVTGPGSITTVQIERLPADATDLGWEPAGDPVTLTPDRATARDGTNPVVRWAGRITAPAPKPGERLRLAVREEEMIETDPGVAQAQQTGGFRLTGPPTTPIPEPAFFRYYRRRLVYADNIALPT